MTTFISQQKGIPPSDYAPHVERVLAKSSRPMVRPWLAWVLVVTLGAAALFIP